MSAIFFYVCKVQAAVPSLWENSVELPFPPTCPYMEETGPVSRMRSRVLQKEK